MEIINIKIDSKAPPAPEPTPLEKLRKFEWIIEDFKVKNPFKYELRKEELAVKLAAYKKAAGVKEPKEEPKEKVKEEPTPEEPKEVKVRGRRKK